MKQLTIVLGALAFASLSFAMPPAPGLIDRMRSEGTLEQLSSLHIDARQRGVNEGFRIAIDKLKRDNPDQDEFHIICILVDFADNEADTNTNSREHFENMLFSQGEYRTGSMTDWYLENSYDNILITGDVVGWYRMERDYAYYVNGQQGFGQYPRNGQGLARDALRAADAGVNYQDYDNNNNRVAEGIFIVHAGQGAEQTGSNDMIWSHAWAIPRDLRLDNMSFNSYAMEPENGRIGVFGHELAHSLFGLPDLYDTDYHSAGVGSWSMMAGGSWGGGGNRPVHFDAWCKTRIGVVSPFPIIEDEPNLVMEPVEITDDVNIIWRSDVAIGNEYFLVENRQRIGFDESLPASGMLIWHCDDGAENNTHPWWPGQGNLHNILALEQADGDYHLEHNSNGGDDGDPFPGSTWNTYFGDESEPDSRDYGGTSTEVAIADMEQQNDGRMNYSVYLNNAPEPVVPNVFLLERIPPSHIFPDPDVQEDTTDEVSLLNHQMRWMGAAPAEQSDHLPDNIFDYNAIIYIESWRDDDSPAPGLTLDEQYMLSIFLEGGGMLLLIGPDIATNLEPDSLLWPYLHANLLGSGVSREEGNLSRLTGNPESRIAGQNFVYRARGAADHFVDIVDAKEGAQTTFTDRTHQGRGVMYTGDSGYRAILQPFLFGGLVDWGGTKEELIRTYFEYFRFIVTNVASSPKVEPVSQFNLDGVYPNPFNNQLNVKWNNASARTWINIYDINGRSVGTLNINAGAGVRSWHPAGLSAGEYLLQPNLPGSKPTRVTYLK